MDVSIGAFEAKAQRSRLLRAVVHGEWFTITVRAKPVADLLPHRADGSGAMAATVSALVASPRIQAIPEAEVAGFVAESLR